MSSYWEYCVQYSVEFPIAAANAQSLALDGADHGAISASRRIFRQYNNLPARLRRATTEWQQPQTRFGQVSATGWNLLRARQKISCSGAAVRGRGSTNNVYVAVRRASSGGSAA